MEKGIDEPKKRRENLDNALLCFLSPRFHPSLAVHFGELNNLIQLNTQPRYQSLCLERSKDRVENLQMACLKDLSKLLFMCYPASKESKIEVGKKDETVELGNKDEISKAHEAVSEIRAEVDKLSQRVSSIQASVQSGIKLDEKEFIISTELLMVQLLKLDGVVAEGQAKVQRKNEVNRIQSYVDTLDDLKARNSKSVS